MVLDILLVLAGELLEPRVEFPPRGQDRLAPRVASQARGGRCSVTMVAAGHAGNRCRVHVLVTPTRVILRRPTPWATRIE
jgi:hypothetical protein